MGIEAIKASVVSLDSLGDSALWLQVRCGGSRDAGRHGVPEHRCYGVPAGAERMRYVGSLKDLTVK